MKKSTLLTTIAMIVVVVVALSTATYAWFSSSTASTATAHVTTAAAADLAMYNGAYQEGDVIKFTSAGSDITLNSNLLAGLFAPTDAIASTLSSGNSTGCTAGSLAAFFSGEKINNVDKVKAKTVADVKPNAIRVVGGTANAQNKKIKLTVYIDLGATTSVTDPICYAASEVTFFIVAKDTAGTAHTYTNGYIHGNNAIDSANVGDNVPAGTTVNADSGLTKTVYDNSTVKTGENATLRYTNFSYTETDIKSGEQTLVAAEHTYKKYEIELCTVTNIGDGVNLLIYTWLNGYTVEDSAVGAALDIVYAFTLANAS